MINTLRKHRHWLWIIIAILLIPFVFYFNNADFTGGGSEGRGRIYGREITDVEFSRNARLFDLARDLGMFNFLQELAMGGRTESEVQTQFVTNLMIIKEEADRLGIHPTPGEITATVKEFRAFRGESGFDINRYTAFTQNALGAFGFTEAHIEELAAHEIRLTRLKQLLATGVEVTEAEVRTGYEQLYGKLDVGVIRVRSADFANEATISEEDIAKYFESHKAGLKTEEKRKVEFVSFVLNEEEKKLAGKERIGVLQKLADRANDFTQMLLDKKSDFRGAAEKFGTPIVATGEFTRAAPDPQLKDPQMAQTAFEIDPRQPVSDAIQGTDGFYVMHLAEVTEPRPLSLDEARPKITEALRTTRLNQIAMAKGSAAATLVREGIRTGETPEVAAQKAGMTFEKIPTFSLLADEKKPESPAPDAKPPEADSPELTSIKGAVAELNPGEVSQFVPTKDGGLVAVLLSRAKPEEAKYEHGKKEFEERYLTNKRKLVFYEWLRERRQAAGVQLAQAAQS